MRFYWRFSAPMGKLYRSGKKMETFRDRVGDKSTWDDKSLLCDLRQTNQRGTQFPPSFLHIYIGFKCIYTFMLLHICYYMDILYLSSASDPIVIEMIIKASPTARSTLD